MRKITPIEPKDIQKYAQDPDYDILYRGVKEGQDMSKVLWLTTSRDYASNYGEVVTYAVPIATLDCLANPKTLDNYMLADFDDEDCPYYEPESFDIARLKADGYTGYYFYEDEYDCLCVCIFVG